jgi:serine phosphatase RsbU (regulator of sigma subunit)
MFAAVTNLTEGRMQAPYHDAFRPGQSHAVAQRLVDVIRGHRHEGSRELVDTIFQAVDEFRGETPPHDDMTAVAITITA